MKEERTHNTTMKEGQRNWYAVSMAVCAGFFLLLHLTFVGFTNDDVYFRDVAGMWDSLPALIVHRYLTDSSRV